MKALLKNIDDFTLCDNDISLSYDHFHFPCSQSFISSPKTSSKVKKVFCQNWINKTQYFINHKIQNIDFCKVVCLICPNDLWDSQIIIFYNKGYYDSFWKRNGDYQKWEKIMCKNKRSYKQTYGITTSLKEIGYIEKICDEDINCEHEIWFYGELI